MHTLTGGAVRRAVNGDKLIEFGGQHGHTPHHGSHELPRQCNCSHARRTGWSGHFTSATMGCGCVLPRDRGSKRAVCVGAGGVSRSCENPGAQRSRHGFRRTLGQSDLILRVWLAVTSGLVDPLYTPLCLGAGATGHDAGADTGAETSRAGGHLHPPQAATGTTPGRCRLSLPIPQTGRSLSGRRVTSSRQPAYPHLPCQFGCLPGLLLLTALQRRASFLEATR